MTIGAECCVTLFVVDIAGVDIVQAVLHGDFPREMQGGLWRVRMVLLHFEIWVEGGKM